MSDPAPESPSSAPVAPPIPPTVVARKPGSRKTNDGVNSLHPGKPTESQLFIARMERQALQASGKTVEVEDILERAGFARARREKSTDAPDKADMQRLRLHITPARQAALGVVLLGLEDGILRIATSKILPQEDRRFIVELLQSGKLQVDDVVVENWDRSTMSKLLREQTEISSERLITTFAKLESEPDNANYVEGATKDIIAEALQMRASDIHITSSEEVGKSWIAYRIDGEMNYKHLLPPHVIAPIITRLKTDAQMDSAERRRPQDGRISYPWQGRNIDIRVATVPVAPKAEKMVMRLLDAANLRPFADLFQNAVPIGLRLRTRLTSPVKDGGLIIFSGPTGSGKSTSLFACSQVIDRSKKSVYEVSQPIEYENPLISQVPINEGSSITMADIIRAFLRLDPDMVIVGELRDEPTVEAALRIVESGHLVLSTIHANTAEGTLDRMAGFLSDSFRKQGLYILGNYITAVLNQRLIKTVCPSCKTMVTAGEGLGERRCHALNLPENFLLSKASPRGCNLCNKTGFLGRDMILEAIFAPESPSARRRMTRTVTEKGLSAMIDDPGNDVHTRAASIDGLLRRGVLDVETAARLLNDYLDSADLDSAPAPGFPDLRV